MMHKRRRGMALLMTLAILALISVYMTEFFFDTTLHTRGIQNFQASFRARAAAKSMFKAVLIALQEGETEFFNNLQLIYSLAGMNVNLLNPPDPIPIPGGLAAFEGFEDAIFFSPYIRPIDHLFSLERMREQDARQDREKLVYSDFLHLIKQIPIESPDPDNPNGPPIVRYLDADVIEPIYGAIWDWMDSDDEIYRSGAESNDYVNPEFIIKNRPIDRIEELKLIRGVVESEIPFEEWKRHITTHDVGFKDALVGPKDPKINVNLASKEDIAFFLKRFNFTSTYHPGVANSTNVDNTLAKKQDYVDQADEIADTLTTEPEPDPANDPNLSVADKLAASLQSFGQRFEKLDEVRQRLFDEHDLRVSAESDFFILYSEWYEIRLVAEINNIQAEVSAVVHVERDQRNGKAKPDKTTIHDFQIR